MQRLKLPALLHRIVSRRRPQSPLPYVRPRLPPELWDLVLEELCDEDLFTAAHVCAGFNDRAIVIYFQRRNISRQGFSIGSLIITSDLLRVLQLSRFTPEIHTLVCHFWAFRVLRDLGFLRDFILRCGGIQELSVFFHGNVATAYETDTIFPYPQQSLLTVLGETLCAMTAKSMAPIVIICDSAIHMIGRWATQHSPQVAWMKKTRFSVTFRKEVSPLCDFVWGRGWRRIRVASGRITAIRVISVTSQTTEPFTLIIVNKDIARELDFGASVVAQDAASPSDLKIIIPHITLPSLQFLWINDNIDPTILTDFLLRHSTIYTIRYKPASAPRAPTLLTHPLALPFLTRLYCPHPSNLGLLLDAFERSPRLEAISITFARHSPSRVVALKRGLRRLSLLPTSICLELRVGPAGEGFWYPIDDAERQIVGCLYPVSSVVIDAYFLRDIAPHFHWLAMLPALTRLGISVLGEHRADDGTFSPAVTSLLQDARAALPWVPEIGMQRH
ncbi:hypothetical protein DFH07DRAFT_798957 [Mycena maculata]|uniref:F-box domain-containing protein n=1 Tax=Mycena maculata TaxID=230809 RepID=A0AAD7K563_9AGAR|nr:hypothetical protein DFH07DRAFT_798957 [Mycena maculata]